MPSVFSLTPSITEPPSTTDPVEALKLFRAIRSGRHPLTSEGVILNVPGRQPIKIKFNIDRDVLIKKIFEGATGKRAGGFEYALPDAPSKTVGRVGSGFSHETLADMLHSPKDYEGRIARIKAQEQYPSGAYRAPRFISLHEG